MIRHLRSFVLCLIVIAACAATHGLRAQTQAVQVDPSTLYSGYTQPQYKDVTMQSLYVTMRDGVKIAIDVVLPKELPANAKLPTVIRFTRYHRSEEGAGANGYEKFFASYGYACVSVDARGTGASFGLWPIP
ncbi:MAG: acetylxylan esterase, partial [Acidobacteria bacterium]|nr:acetylxylan esterase [Acidobacteriota bacterium]